MPALLVFTCIAAKSAADRNLSRPRLRGTPESTERRSAASAKIRPHPRQQGSIPGANHSREPVPLHPRTRGNKSTVDHRGMAGGRFIPAYGERIIDKYSNLPFLYMDEIGFYLHFLREKSLPLGRLAHIIQTWKY